MSNESRERSDRVNWRSIRSLRCAPFPAFIHKIRHGRVVVKHAMPLKQSPEYRRNPRRNGCGRGGRCLGYRWIKHNAFLPANEFKSCLEISESSSSLFGHGFLIDSVDEPERNRAVIPLLNDVIAKFLFVIGFGIQRCFQNIGCEPFLDVGTPLLCIAGSDETENECNAK